MAVHYLGTKLRHQLPRDQNRLARLPTKTQVLHTSGIWHYLLYIHRLYFVLTFLEILGSTI